MNQKLVVKLAVIISSISMQVGLLVFFVGKDELELWNLSHNFASTALSLGTPLCFLSLLYLGILKFVEGKQLNEQTHRNKIFNHVFHFFAAVAAMEFILLAIWVLYDTWQHMHEAYSVCNDPNSGVRC